MEEIEAIRTLRRCVEAVGFGETFAGNYLAKAKCALAIAEAALLEQKKIRDNRPLAVDEIKAIDAPTPVWFDFDEHCGFWASVLYESPILNVEGPGEFGDMFFVEEFAKFKLLRRMPDKKESKMLWSEAGVKSGGLIKLKIADDDGGDAVER